MKAIALKVTGPFTEWVAPTMKDLYESNADFREWYEESGMLDKLPPVLIPFGGEDYISAHVDCLADRLAESNDTSIWSQATDLLNTALWTALNEGRRIEVMGVVIEPFTAEELPITPLERFADYGPYADALRASVDALGKREDEKKLGSAWNLLYDLHSIIEDLGDDAEVEVSDGKVFVVSKNGKRRQAYPWTVED